MKQNYYNWQRFSAKAEYHLRNVEILTSEIDNTTDPDEKHHLIARRTHHRRMARKYIAWAKISLEE